MSYVIGVLNRTSVSARHCDNAAIERHLDTDILMGLIKIRRSRQLTRSSCVDIMIGFYLDHSLVRGQYLAHIMWGHGI